MGSGQPWQDVLQALQEHDIEFLADDHAAEQQHTSLWRAMDMSVRVLPEDKRKRFAELAVYKPGERIPEETVLTLWEHTGSLNARKARALLVEFHRRSLVQLERKVDETGSTVTTLYIHDLLQLFATGLAEKIFEDIATLHGLLLDAYYMRCPEGWSSGPDDGYFPKYLPIHLTYAGWWDDLLSVISDNRMGYIRRWIEEGEGEIGLTCLPRLVTHMEDEEGQSITIAGICTQIARMHIARGNHTEGEYFLFSVLQHTSHQSGLRERAIALHELGSLQLYKGNKQTALNAYREALALCNQREPIQHDEAAANLVAMATIKIEEYNYACAIRLAHRALRRSIMADNTRHTVAAQILLAQAYKDCAQWDQAYSHLLAASILIEANKLPLERIRLDLISAWLNYVRAVLEGFSVDCAIRYFQDALEGALQAHHISYSNEARLGLAWCALMEVRTEEAHKWLEETTSFPLHELHSGLASLQLVGNAAVFHQYLRFHDAQRLYREAIEFASKYSETKSEADALVGLGAIHYHVEEFARAMMYWDRAKNLAVKCSPVRHRLVKLGIEQSSTNPHFTPL